jgi:hypothetical protein
MHSDEDGYQLQAADTERQARSVMNDVDRPPKRPALAGASRKGALAVGQRLAGRARLERPKAFRLR